MPPRGRPLPVLFLTVFLDLLGFGIIIPLLPFLAESLRATPLGVAGLVAGYSLMQFLVAPLWGRLSDRIGRRPVLMTSIAGSIVGLLLFALSDSYWMLLLSRLLHGAMNANIAVAQAYIADVTTMEERTRGMGMFGAAVGLGFIFGPATGGLLGRYGFAVPGLVAAGLAALNLILALLLLPESPGPRAGRGHREWSLLNVRALRESFRAGPLGTLLVVALLFMVGFSAMEAMFALWSERTLGWDERENGLLFTYLGVLIAIVQGGLIGPLRRRHGERPLVAGGLVALALGLGALPFATTLALLLAATGLLALGNGLFVPALSALVSFEAADIERGSVLGLYQSLSALGRVIGPLLGGWLFSAVGVGAPFLAGAALMGVCLLLVARVPSRRQGAPPTPS